MRIHAIHVNCVNIARPDYIPPWRLAFGSCSVVVGPASGDCMNTCWASTSSFFFFFCLPLCCCDSLVDSFQTLAALHHKSLWYRGDVPLWDGPPVPEVVAKGKKSPRNYLSSQATRNQCVSPCAMLMSAWFPRLLCLECVSGVADSNYFSAVTQIFT